MSTKHIPIEVTYALPDEQLVLALEVEEGTSLRQAIEASGILERFSGIDLEACKVGVFGKVRSPDDILRAGDRVEIYRPLIADPKEVRRRRAAKGKAMKKGAGAESGD